MKKLFSKAVTSIIVMTFMIMSIQLPLAYAAMVETEQVIEYHSDVEREKIVAFLNRVEVQEELQQQGVSAELAKARVTDLNDEEVQLLAGKIDELPAGGIVGTLIGAGLVVFVVLMITDVLGFTDVFPFVHPHAH